MRLEGGALFIAPVGSDPRVGPWREVGHLVDGVTFAPALDEEPVITPARLTTGSTTVSFRLGGSTKALRRLVMGPRWSWDRHRLRQVTRAKYRARARRRR